MAWVYLVLAGLLEVGWAIGLKYTEGFTRPLPSLLTAVSIAGSMYLLAVAAQRLQGALTELGPAQRKWISELQITQNA